MPSCTFQLLSCSPSYAYSANAWSFVLICTEYSRVDCRWMNPQPFNLATIPVWCYLDALCFQQFLPETSPWVMIFLESFRRKVKKKRRVWTAGSNQRAALQPGCNWMNVPHEILTLCCPSSAKSATPSHPLVNHPIHSPSSPKVQPHRQWWNLMALALGELKKTFSFTSNNIILVLL